jgi:hypothetical protein
MPLSPIENGLFDEMQPFEVGGKKGSLLVCFALNARSGPGAW